jgi:serine/threonine protein kinase
LAASQVVEELSLDRAQDTWTVLSGHVDAFIAAWSHPDSEPPLVEFLPAGPPSLRRLVLIELIKVDLEHRWLNNRQPRLVEAYLAEFPEFSSDGAPWDLIYEEFQVRREAGDKVKPDAYFARFPKQVEELRRLLHETDVVKSLSITRKRGPMEMSPGEQVDDFDLLTLLGTGAFAQVFLARQRSMQRLVALKVSAERGDEPQTMAQLDHPHVVRVYDQRVMADRGIHLLYMQYVAGGSLQDVLNRIREVPEGERTGKTLLEVIDKSLSDRGESPPVGSTLRERLSALPWPEVVCWLGARLGNALAYANRQGVLHRDVKPANVLLTAEGAPRLVDFNTSFSSKVDGASPSAFFGGSLAYMSPEQLEAFNPAHPREPDELDGRSDLYSLGVMLWELLTGYRPFPPEILGEEWSETISGMAADRREGPDESVSPLPAVCPRGLRSTLKRCLAAEPDARPSSGDELARELDLCLHRDASRLLHPIAGGWRDKVRRHPIVFVVLAALLPNVLATIYNFAYNLGEIVGKEEDAKLAFWITQGVVNSIIFPVAIAAFAIWTRPVARSLSSLESSDSDRQRARRRSLSLGHFAAGLSVAGWSLAGLAFPLGLWILVGDVTTRTLIHFFFSLLLCGLIAAAYPFFTVTFLATRVLYPALKPSPDSASASALERLSRQTWLYLLLAASVPMLAMTVLLYLGVSRSPLLALLGLGGLIGFALAFRMARSIQNDLAALQIVVSPNLDSLSK